MIGYLIKLIKSIFNMNNNIDEHNQSNKIELVRFCYAPEGTFGLLTYKEFSCFTVEQPWRDNRPYRSCIPDGEYNVKWHDSPKFGRTLAVEGGTVSLYPSDSHERSAILFHAGNWPTDFEGCIGPGETFACIRGKMGVSSSRVTLEEFFDHIGNNDNISMSIKPTEGA